MNPRAAVKSTIENTIAQLKELQGIFKSSSPKETQLKTFVTILQNLYIKIDNQEDCSKEAFTSLIETLGETEEIITSLLDPKMRSQYTEETLTVLFTAINDHIAEMGTVFAPTEEEIDDEEEEKKEEDEAEKIAETEKRSASTLAISTTEETPSTTTATPITRDILGLSAIDFEQQQADEKNDRYDTIILKQIEIESLIERIQTRLTAEKKVLLQSKSNLEKQNAEIELDVLSFIKTRDALVDEENKIKQSTLTSKKHRKEHPVKIATCNAMIQKHQATYSTNLNAIKTLELRCNAFQKIVDQLTILGETLSDHQQHSTAFDYAQCKVDILEIENKSNILLDKQSESIEKQKAAHAIFEQIEAMETVYAPPKDRMNAMKGNLALQPQRTPIKMDAVNDGEQLDNIQLLITTISQTQAKLQYSLNHYIDLAKNPSNNPAASKRRDDLASIYDKLNNIMFGLAIHPNAQFYQLANEELPHFPKVFNAPNYLFQLRAWTNKNNDRTNAILAEELKQDIQEELEPQKPSFFSHLWRNKFAILGMTLGGLGGVALGVFTFGLSTVGLTAILTYAAAVGSSAIGGACTNGLLGWWLDRWIEPVKPLPPLPPRHAKRHFAEAAYDDSESDEETAEKVVQIKRNNKPDNGREKKLSEKEKRDVNASSSIHSFQNRGGHPIQIQIDAAPVVSESPPRTP